MLLWGLGLWAVELRGLEMRLWSLFGLEPELGLELGLTLLLDSVELAPVLRLRDQRLGRLWHWSRRRSRILQSSQ